MSSIITIAKKEFLDTLRDRRTLIIMIALPLLLFPAIFFITIQVQQAVAQKAKEKTLKVGIIAPEGEGQALIEEVSKAPALELIYDIEPGTQTELIRSDSLDLILQLEAGFNEALDSLHQGQVVLYYQRTEDDELRERLEAPIEAYESRIKADRLIQLAITEQTIDPIEVNTQNVDSNQEVIGKLAGGFLPYLFVIFSFLGCMYPAIDLFTGEKERGTIETILTLPVDRKKILIGKMIVVALAGILSALVAILSLYFSLQFLGANEGLARLTEALSGMLSVGSIVLLLSLIIPLAIFFAGLQVALATYARSFKEAQSTISPLNIMVIIPAAIGLMPGIELNIGTALIPILNVALASKEILAGTIDYGLLAIVFVSLIALAAVGIFVSARWFGKETNILRT